MLPPNLGPENKLLYFSAKYYIKSRLFLWIGFFLIIFIALIIDELIQDFFNTNITIKDNIIIILWCVGIIIIDLIYMNWNKENNPENIQKHFFWAGLFLIYYANFYFGILLFDKKFIEYFISMNAKSISVIIRLIFHYCLFLIIGIILIHKNIKNITGNLKRHKISFSLLSILYFIVTVTAFYNFNSIIEKIGLIFICLIPCIYFFRIFQVFKIEPLPKRPSIEKYQTE